MLQNLCEWHDKAVRIFIHHIRTLHLPQVQVQLWLKPPTKRWTKKLELFIWKNRRLRAAKYKLCKKENSFRMVSLVLCNPSCGWSSHFHEYLRTFLMIRHYSSFLRVFWPTETVFSGSHGSPPNPIYCYSFDSIVAPASKTVCPCWCLFKLQSRCFRTRCRWKYSWESTGSFQRIRLGMLYTHRRKQSGISTVPKGWIFII